MGGLAGLCLTGDVCVMFHFSLQDLFFNVKKNVKSVVKMIHFDTSGHEFAMLSQA